MGYRTIASFRSESADAPKAANCYFVLIAGELGLLGGTLVAVDGSLMHENASAASITTTQGTVQQFHPIVAFVFSRKHL